jgi:hypothetical protein
MPDQIPPEALKHWQAIQDAVEAAPDHLDGNQHSYIQGLSTEELDELAKQIIADALVIGEKYG